MKTDPSSTPVRSDDKIPAGLTVTVFQAEQKEYGFRIIPAGQYPLESAANQPPSVVAFLQLPGRQIPVIRPNTQSAQTPVVSSQSCVVLFEHKIGRTAILTGRLFENVGQVLDLIVELSDVPTPSEVLYASSDETVLRPPVDRQDPFRMQDSY